MRPEDAETIGKGEGIQEELKAESRRLGVRKGAVEPSVRLWKLEDWLSWGVAWAPQKEQEEICKTRLWEEN
jgi:hypothetical protein